MPTLKALIPAALATLLFAAAAAPAQNLIPIPRELRSTSTQPLPQGLHLALTGNDPEDRFTVADLTQSLADRQIPTSGPFTITLTRTAQLPPEAQAEGYTITPGPGSLTLAAQNPTGLFYAAQTLKQLIQHDGSEAILHLATIRDWPAMPHRGIQDDLSRGPIPTLAFQKHLVQTLAAYKINIYSPYFEETQQYASNPLFAPPGGSISAADARALVAFAAQYHVTVIPDQEAFGHLRHDLIWEQYQPLAETPHGAVLAPGQPGSLMLIHQMFGELASLYPGPYLHIGADETVDLGLGQTKSDVDQRGLGPVYLDFVQKIVADLAPLHRKILFWGDIAQSIVQGSTAYSAQAGADVPTRTDPNLLIKLPAAFKQNTIAVAWWYTPTPRNGFSKFLTPFTAAGIETWVAPGVNNWSVVWPDSNDALTNIQQFVLEGQRQHSTGVLNTTWYDDGEALSNNNWYGLLFGAEASWHQGEASIPAFQQSFAQVFHGDSSGKLNEAQTELMACHALLRSAKIGDGSDGLFWQDPWSKDGQTTTPKIRPVLHDLRLHAERALTLIAQARAAHPSTDLGAPHPAFGMWDWSANPLPSNPTALHNPDAIDALELGARRLDFIGLKYQLSDEIAQGYARAQTAQQSPDKKLHSTTDRELNDIASGVNGRLRDLRDTYALLRDLYAQAWLRSNRPYALRPVLERYDQTIQLWQTRADRIKSAQRQLSGTQPLPSPGDLGIPPAH